MGLVHQLFVIRVLEVFDLVVAVQTAFLFKPTCSQHQGCFQYPSFEERLHFCFTRTLNEIKMATAASDSRLLEHLVGDVFRIRSLRGLYRFDGQLVAEFTPGPTLVELGVCKVAEVTSRLSDLEVPRFSFVLMAGGAVDLHALDLIFFYKMGLMNKCHFLGKLNLFGLEWVIRFTMASSGHAAVVGDCGYCLDRLAPQFDIGTMAR